MRALANYIMRGRAQAAVVALVGNLLPLISPATVGLVTLRRGLADGGLVLLWALLPSLLAYLYSSDSATMALLTIAAMVTILPVGLILKHSGSWQLTLVVAVVVAILSALTLEVLFADQVAGLQSQLVRAVGGQDVNGAATLAETDMSADLGFLGYVLALNAITSLILSRWWQSELYNPGGFGVEFRALKLAKPLAALSLAGVVFCVALPEQYVEWMALLGLPLLFGGIGLVHYAVKTLSLGGHWLVIFYGLLILIGPIMSLLMIVVGFLDSLMNLRPRLAARKTGGE